MKRKWKGKRMKVFTLNTHSWMEKEPLEKLEQLAQVILARDYDLFALQEVNQTIAEQTVETDNYFHPEALAGLSIHSDNFALLLAESLRAKGINYYWCWTPVHIGYDKFHEGLALFSKEPIEAFGQVVSNKQEFADYRTRKVLLGKTMCKGHEVLALSCHNSWWTQKPDEGFFYEWQQTLKLLENFELPKILLGDFNNSAEQRMEGYDLVKETFLDVYVYADEKDGEYTVNKEIDGWTGNSQSLRIDFIFTTETIQAKRYEVVFDGRKTPIISDHFGVEAELSIDNKEG